MASLQGMVRACAHRWSDAARRGNSANRDIMNRQHGKPPSVRQLRVGEMIRHALAEIIARGALDDEALNSRHITVTEVKLSPDLRNATVYALPFGGDEGDAVIKALGRHARFLRGELSRRVELKYMPELTFRLDESFDEADRIDALLRSPAVSRDLDP
jgi:ribosome-binding factor A